MRRRTLPIQTPGLQDHSPTSSSLPSLSKQQNEVGIRISSGIKRYFYCWCFTFGNVLLLTWNVWHLYYPPRGLRQQQQQQQHDGVTSSQHSLEDNSNRIFLDGQRNRKDKKQNDGNKLRYLQRRIPQQSLAIRGTAATSTTTAIIKTTNTTNKTTKFVNNGRRDEVAEDDDCNLYNVSVLLLDVHWEGNLGDEMETTPLLQELYNCHVTVTVALSEWLPKKKDRIHSRTSREHMLVQHITTQSYSTLNPYDYHAVIVAPGPWKICILHRQWMKGISPSSTSTSRTSRSNHKNDHSQYDPTINIPKSDNNDIVEETSSDSSSSSSSLSRKIDIFFGGSFMTEEKDYCKNPEIFIEDTYLKQDMVQLVVLRESVSYQYVIDRRVAAAAASHDDTTIHDDGATTINNEGNSGPPQILLSGDLSYSFQPSMAALEYWREYYISQGYYGHRYFTSTFSNDDKIRHQQTASSLSSPPPPESPMILLFSRANNFARGVRILRNENEPQQQHQQRRQRRPLDENDPQSNRMPRRGRRRRPLPRDDYEVHQNDVNDNEVQHDIPHADINEQLPQEEDDQEPLTTTKLMVKVANGTKILLNTSHIVFASSSDIEDASHFQFLRDEYPYIFPRNNHISSSSSSSTRDPFVLCQSVEQLFALVSLADHVYTDRYHPGVVAHMFDIPFTVLSYSQEQIKLNGLADLTSQHSPQELQEWNRHAFDELRSFLQRRKEERTNDDNM